MLGRIAHVLLAALLGLPLRGMAQPYPLLEEMNRQTQSLYRDVQAGIVRVQLPLPRWAREAASRDDPLAKWAPIVDPEVKKKLEEQREQVYQGQLTKMSASVTPGPPASQPTTRLGSTWTAQQDAGNQTILKSDGAGGQSIVIDAGPKGPRGLSLSIDSSFVPNNIGLLIDDRGHVMVPIYIERDLLADRAIPVMIEDRQSTARFVASDEKTNVTILKLEAPLGRPLKLADLPPADGSMVMLLNPNGGGGRLMIWTGGEKDYGVIVGIDGSVPGIVRYGKFIGGAAYKSVADQLIKVGTVQRAVLGARLTEVARDDAMRSRNPRLGERTAILVEEIAVGSLAEQSGLRRGDFILQVGQTPLIDLGTWAAISAQGGQTRLQILRGEQILEIEMNLRPRQ